MNFFVRTHLVKIVSCNSKILVLLSGILVLSALTGCSSVEGFILYHSGTLTNTESQQYIDLKNSNQLDEDGQYISPELESAEGMLPPENSIHVTFASNAYFDIAYYSDAELKMPLNTQSCYLAPGDSIYASTPICNHPSSNWYSFDKYSIYSYDSGEKGEELFWNTNNQPGLVLQIPADYTGSEISVEPVGKYETRHLELQDYYTDSTGNSQELSGKWTINKSDTSDNTIDISPVEPISVDYQYDSQEYAFISSEPSSFYHENGLVRFETTYASDSIEKYTVVLRLREDDAFEFDPSQYSAEHGTMTFIYDGRTITGISYIPDGETISYIATPDEGYKHPNGTGKIKINASNAGETKKGIQDAIKFYLDKDVEVKLPRPVGGSIEYKANGKVLTGNTCTLPSGTTITMKFTGWNGWKCNVMDGESYEVTDKERQSVFIEGIDINNKVFEEQDSHKPTLNVILKDSVKNIRVDVSAFGISGIKSTGLNYDTGKDDSILPDWLGQHDSEIFKGKVGTSEGVALKFYDDAILSGTAIKLEIAIKDIKGEESTSIRYITKLPAEEQIDFYTKAEMSKSTTIYEDITVTASAVNVSEYIPRTVSNATIKVQVNDITKPYTLKNGDVLEPSRNVKVTITPGKDHYVTGSKVQNDIYSETMSYSKWEKDFQKILDKHPIKDIWHVTLNTSDSYGTCTYKLDGKVVSGTIEIREGQKLSLEYTLTDTDCEIKREDGLIGIVSGILNNNKETVDIPVSSALNNKTINRFDYITVAKRG